MAVVSKVPTDVLTEIFYLLCKKPISVSKLNNSRRKKYFPWAVGLVCRQWRIAFLSYPPIWASLELSDGDSSNHDVRTESYAKEINRRLALYLQRSGGYPLRLDIILWSDQNRECSMMALEMLSACSHRWQTAKFRLFCHWLSDSIIPCKGQLPILEWLEFSGNLEVFPEHARIFEVAPRLTHARIGPWAKGCGWILPWTQLTELFLTLNDYGAFVIENGDVQNLLPMLHNIQELRFRFRYYEVDFEGGFPQFAPTPLNQLRVLEVPHPAILSWFEAPSLCELYFADYKKHQVEPLDVHEQISSLIQRSSCRIRKLAFNSCRKFYVGTLEDVEELVIDYKRPYGIRSSIDISSLPNLRFLTIICWQDKDFESSITSLATALKSPARSECLYGTSINLLERVMVELHYRREQTETLKRRLVIDDESPVVDFSQGEPFS